MLIIIININHMALNYILCDQKRNFVVKCEGNSLVWNQYIMKPEEKNVGRHGTLYPHCLKKGGDASLVFLA